MLLPANKKTLRAYTNDEAPDQLEQPPAKSALQKHAYSNILKISTDKSS